MSNNRSSRTAASRWREALWPVPAKILKDVGIKPEMDVIDLCSGDGWFTFPLSTQRAFRERRAAMTLREVQMRRPLPFGNSRKTTVPTLVMHGDGLAHARHRLKRIFSAGLCTLPKEHPITLEAPALFNQLLKRFFTTVRARQVRVRDLHRTRRDAVRSESEALKGACRMNTSSSFGRRAATDLSRDHVPLRPESHCNQKLPIFWAG